MRTLLIGAVLGLAASLLAPRVSAQTWSAARSRPALWQVVSIDQSGEAGWPYGREDVAGDGLDAFADDEAAADLRSVYADADGERSWFRAYVAASAAPAAGIEAYFFIDSDARESTGGRAQGDAIAPGFSADRSGGGYERALGVRGDGSAIGAWEWNEPLNAWAPIELRPGALRPEVGRTTDPLAIGVRERGYLQVDVEPALAWLRASCDGQIFVRLRNGAPRALADDARDDAACRASGDAYGDPVVVRSFFCRADAECPNDGRCRDGLCLFAYECTGDRECRDSERCTANRCVRTVDQTCGHSTECGGLVCDGMRCTACAESGPRACGAGLWCSPNGSCIDADIFEPVAGFGRVQGGAFHCAASSGAQSGSSFCMLLLSLLAFRLVAARRRAAFAHAKASTTRGTR
jgi:hypothetical protein